MLPSAMEGAPGTPRLPSVALETSCLHASSSLSSCLPTQAEPQASAECSGHPTTLLNLRKMATCDSSASSIINIDFHDDILIQDVEADSEDGEDVTAMTVDPDLAKLNDASKQSLRNQLRKTLSTKSSVPPSCRMGKDREINTVPIEEAQHPPRQYFVLTDAGKPVFTSFHETGDVNCATVFGIMQALISIFFDDDDKLRCINAGRTRISFLLRSPLYYACASSWGEPESVTRSHLEILHLQILSIVTATQLHRIFERRNNFDLGRLLNGADIFLNSLLVQLEFDLAISTSSLQCLQLDYSIRKKIGDALVPTSKMRDCLYIILVAQGRVVTLLRPKKHSIHPADIHIVLNTIYSPSLQKSPASSSWIPICLPRFDPSSFVSMYVSFLKRNEKIKEEQNAEYGDLKAGQSKDSLMISAEQQSLSPTVSETALVCISKGGHFDTIRIWGDSVISLFEKDGLLEALLDAQSSGQTQYTVSDLHIPGLRHFIYKSRPQVQITTPSFEDPYDSLPDRRRLVTLYQTLYDAIHAKSGQEEALKLQYIKTGRESVMGWITQPFELYITMSVLLPKTAVINAANSVARWVKREEPKLFIKDSPVF